jgi:hypothetical protein
MVVCWEIGLEEINMENLDELLEPHSDRHRLALRWFVEKAGTNNFGQILFPMVR